MRRFLGSLATCTIFCALIQPAAAQQTFVPDSGTAWYSSVGTIMLTRENPEAALIGSNGPADDVGYNTSLVDFGPKFGYEVAIGRRLAEGTGLEARYFNVDLDTSVPDFVSQTGLYTSVANNNGSTLLGLPGTVLARTAYESRLQNCEINLLRQLTPNIGVIAGFRYLELAEELRIDYSDPVGNGSTQSIRGRNEMFGGQLGVDALLLSRDWLSLTSFTKSGVFYNAAHNAVDANVNNGSLSPFTNSSRGQDDEVAFLFEAGLGVDVRLTRRWSLHTGYNVLWLGNVALASNQIAVSDPTAGATLINPGVNPTQSSGVDTTQLFLHGMTLGLTYAW